MISVVYAVHNEEKLLPQSLRSVEPWVDEIVIVDGESTDKTLEIGKEFGAKIISTTNKVNFHINKQMAINNASGDLILQLDADEVVDRDLQNFILDIHAQGKKGISAWELSRKNLFFNQWLKKGGQYPDRVIRLFWKDEAYLPQKDVHEQMVVKGNLALAEGHLLHYGNPNLSVYLQKFNTYTSFKAKQLAAQKLPRNFHSTFQYLISKPIATFFSLFIRHRGYVDGFAGFLFALLSGAHHAFAYLKYCEEAQNKIGQEEIDIYVPVSQFAKLQNHRGIGRYTVYLQEYLQKFIDLNFDCQKNEAQIVHYHFFDLFTRSLSHKKSRQKLIVTIHDLIPLLFPQHFPVGHKGKLNFLWQKYQVKKADLIIADSLASKNDIMDILKIPADKIRVIYLAANPQLKVASSTMIRATLEQYHLPADYILYVGDINFNKNLRQLIKTLKFLPTKIHLVCVGKNFTPQEIPEWQALEEQLHLSEVENRVIFLNQIGSDEQLSALYTGALAYIQSSFYEGFGLPILEAMRCHCPVICHRNSSLPEVAGEFALYADSPQARDFATQVEEVLSWSKEKRKAWTKKAFDWQENFNWDKTATQTRQAYLDVLKIVN